MSTLKRKFELLNRITALGFNYDESQQLRRISMTLSKWAEDECNGDIQRDEKTGKAFRVFRTHPSVCYNHSEYSGIVKEHRHAVADREAGALKRLKAILANHTEIGAFHQGDPRGCALYVFRRADFTEAELAEMDRHYTRGLAVCA